MTNKWEALIILSPFILFWLFFGLNAIFGFIKEGEDGVDYD